MDIGPHMRLYVKHRLWVMRGKFVVQDDDLMAPIIMGYSLHFPQH